MTTLPLCRISREKTVVAPLRLKSSVVIIIVGCGTWIYEMSMKNAKRCLWLSRVLDEMETGLVQVHTDKLETLRQVLEDGENDGWITSTEHSIIKLVKQYETSIYIIESINFDVPPEHYENDDGDEDSVHRMLKFLSLPYEKASLAM
jgi:hypothetical protein